MTHSFPTRRSSDLALVCRPYREDRTVDDVVVGCGPTEPLELLLSAVEGASTRAHATSPPHIHASGAVVRRSEEHTSELQSLMRISYAVFCLKKKKQNTYM